MTISARGIAAVKLLLVALVSAFAAAALAQPAKSLKEQLIGHWQLVSVRVNDSAKGYGSNPQGSMFADASGHYAVIVISSGPAQSVSVFGTYTVDEAEQSVTLHVDASNLADAAGQDVKRFVALNGDVLIATTRRGPGAVGEVKMVWKRAN